MNPILSSILLSGLFALVISIFAHGAAQAFSSDSAAMKEVNKLLVTSLGLLGPGIAAWFGHLLYKWSLHQDKKEKWSFRNSLDVVATIFICATIGKAVTAILEVDEVVAWAVSASAAAIGGVVVVKRIVDSLIAGVRAKVGAPPEEKSDDNVPHS